MYFLFSAILDGNITLANQYLGYNYSFSGTVAHGKQLGRTIGFPTANITISEDYKLIPKNGVYIVQSVINNQLVFGMMNSGNRPTVDGTTQTIEVHFLNFGGDLYDQNLKITLLHYIREEIKFASLDDLKGQIAKDQLFALNFIATL